MSKNMNGFTDYIKDKIEYTLNIIPFGKLATTAYHHPDIIENISENPIAVFSDTADSLKKAAMYFAIGGASILAVMLYIKAKKVYNLI